ncbi:DUF2182 domain-containing protein [Rhizobiaceae bacterium BDR2-2]|uniref:DUF2182 domain-containing protein n=1 Tax=Ectorhizobium quercum TaxID=2965071 RepID=A0AAE3N668_9HYPH|nr:DUF2182 domain-containing protein [Ectorhizobium quercum]MCX9000005.1 DUF2182 domain-containing protein [Ectorhizobium quercum]
MASSSVLELPSICGELTTFVSVQLFWQSNGIWGLLSSQAAMVAAMMGPFTLGPLLSISDRSFRRERVRGMIAFGLGFACVWLVGGVAISLVHAVELAWLADVGLVTSVSAALALIWHGLPWRQRLLNRCHLTLPVSGHGLAAIAACFRYGVYAALPCIGVCGPLMLVGMSFGSYHLPVMIILAVFLWLERALPPEPCIWGPCNHVRSARRLTSLVRSALRIMHRSVKAPWHA